MGEFVFIFASACLINNFTLAYFLGLCPFFGVTGRLDTAFRLGLANIFVMLITSLAAWFLNTFILPYAPYLRLICFIVVIASTVQFVEMVIKKLSPALFKALGIFLPLITTNCAVMGIALLNIKYEYGLLDTAVFSAASAAGFALAILLFAGVRERLFLSPVPNAMRGTAVALVTAGVMSLAFLGFSGMVQ